MTTQLELQAQCNVLLNALDELLQATYTIDMSDTTKVTYYKAKQIVISTPTQCLAEHDCEVIRKFRAKCNGIASVRGMRSLPNSLGKTHRELYIQKTYPLILPREGTILYTLPTED